MASDRSRCRIVTLADVARDAGVSPMTVSRVINGETSVKSDTRKNVELSIKKLKYRPNIGARRLAGAKVARIGLLYDNPSSSYLGELLIGAVDAASKMGHQLIVSRAEKSRVADMIADNMDQNWDGVILPSPIGEAPGVRKLIARENFPTVFLSGGAKPGRVKMSSASEVMIDNRRAAYEMTWMLIEQGHRRIGFIKGNQKHSGSALRYQGFCDAMEEAELEVNPIYVEEGDFTYRSGMEAAERMLSFDPAPSAIFAGNDDMAAGVLAAGARAGMITPGDLSVVGFDDSPIATTVWPNLTTIRQPVADMAAAALEILESRIWPKTDSENTTPAQKIMDFSLVKRQSAAPPTRR